MIRSFQLMLVSIIMGLTSISVSSYSQGVNAYARVESISGTSLAISSVDQSFDTFNDGDRVIIMQMQDDVLGNTSNSDAFGGLGDINSTGVYEVAMISSVSSFSGTPNTIVLQAPLETTFNTCVNCRVQVFTYPAFGSPDYSSVGNLQPIAWNGDRGGVLAFEVTGTLFLGHSIHANGLGFRGGDRSTDWGGPSCETTVYRTSSTNYAEKGESIFRISDVNYNAGRARILNGGGGGSSHNGGGGGGGNFTSGGQGGAGWSSGGCLPGSGGLGGLALSGYITPNRVFLGGGGGGGHQNNGVGTNGGNGGGIIMIRASRLETTANVSIYANGNSCSNSGNDGAGGGGAGGSILLEIPEFVTSPSSTLFLSANGGHGGSVNDGGEHAGGGGGGQGTIIFSAELPAGDIQYVTVSGTGGCNISNCSSRASNGDGINNLGILSGMPSFLDIEWLEFTVDEGSANTLNLLWRVSGDKRASRYHIERSFDLQNWQRKLELQAISSDDRVESYSVQIPKVGYGRSSYFRIIREDIDGGSSISPLRSFTPLPAEGLIRTPYPNPASNNVEISPLKDGIAINLLSIDGKLIEHLETNETVRLDCKKYGPGVYLIECTSGQQREVHRIIFE